MVLWMKEVLHHPLCLRPQAVQHLVDFRLVVQEFKRLSINIFLPTMQIIYFAVKQTGDSGHEESGAAPCHRLHNLKEAQRGTRRECARLEPMEKTRHSSTRQQHPPVARLGESGHLKV